MTLSKSQYLKALQCYKSLWLHKYKPELWQKPDSSQELLFERGYEVGELAKKLFPNGVEIEFDSENFDQMVEKTKKLIEAKESVIYEATFKEDGLFAMVDILVKSDDGWDIYEVKASTYTKDYHIDDASFQWYILSKRLKLNSIYIVHINNQYTRKGELDISKLFTFDNITDEVLQKQESIKNELLKIEQMLNFPMPDIDIGVHCNTPFECDFKEFCWKHVPQENSVFELSYANGKQWQLYYDAKLSLDDVPDDFSLGSNAKLQVIHHKSQQIKIDKEKIKEFVDSVKYPINFFDFETFMEAVPRFDNQRPYAQIPFQYSLHILYEDGTLEHKEFLGDENSDPRYKLIDKILESITSTGSIVAYNKFFEITQIKNLALFYPKKEKELLSLIDRFVDLAYPFQNKHYYHPGFKGKYSIKVVLPTLFPDDKELDYKSLRSIQNGGDAMEAFASLHLIKDKSKVEQIRKDLLDYCRLDTLAMVKIWEELKKTSLI